MFTTRPTDVSGDPGQEVTLSCAVDGNPAPGYTWFRNGDLNTVSGVQMQVFRGTRHSYSNECINRVIRQCHCMTVRWHASMHVLYIVTTLTPAQISVWSIGTEGFERHFLLVPELRLFPRVEYQKNATTWYQLWKKKSILRNHAN